MPKETINLFSWITQIKRAHGSKVFPPPSSKEELSRVQSTSSDHERKSIILTKYFKGNNMPFHRPHGLVFKKHDKRQPNNTTEAPLSRMDSECSCCAQGCCSSTGHHRHSTTSLSLEDSLDQSASSKEQDPSCPCSDSNSECRRSSTDTSVSSQRESDRTESSLLSSRRTSKTSSILLEEPTAIPCYKKIKEDGDLEDYDDIIEQDESDYSDNVVLRSAICNSLVRLALNG